MLHTRTAWEDFEVIALTHAWQILREIHGCLGPFHRCKLGSYQFLLLMAPFHSNGSEAWLFARLLLPVPDGGNHSPTID